MDEDKIARLAEEASSVAQDERGMTPNQRAMFEAGWKQGFRMGLAPRAMEKMLGDPVDYEVAEVHRQRAHDLLRVADRDLADAEHGVPSVALATSTRALAYLKRAEIELALARENE